MSTWNDVSARLGRNNLPYALARAVLMDSTMTDPEEIAEGVSQAWTAAEWPLSALDEGIWLSLFSYATDEDDNLYVTDDGTASKSDLPEELTLYRGAVEDKLYGMSWTDDLDRAKWFATRFSGFGGDEGMVVKAVVPRDLVLGHFKRRNESEYVLDAEYIEDYVEEVS